MFLYIPPVVNPIEHQLQRTIVYILLNLVLWIIHLTLIPLNLTSKYKQNSQMQ